MHIIQHYVRTCIRTYIRTCYRRAESQATPGVRIRCLRDLAIRRNHLQACFKRQADEVEIPFAAQRVRHQLRSVRVIMA